jgi:hypothetical protein
LPALFARRRLTFTEILLATLEDATMQRVKQASKKKRVTKTALPALGAAGLTFSLAGGASASVVPTGDVPQRPNFAPSPAITLGEEEIADISLATFHLFDKEDVGNGVQVAWRGCGGCRGCRGCGGCRGCRCGAGCRCGGCGVGIVGCAACAVAGCCASWGRCRLC